MWELFLGLALGGFIVYLMQTKSKSTRNIVPTVAVISANEPVVDNDDSVRLLLNALPMGVVVIAADGQERLRNIAATSIAGARHADVLVEVATERLLAMALRGKQRTEEIQLAGPPPRVLEVRAIPLDDGGALAVIDDITERWRIDQVRTDFVANVSHELKTPVGAISVLAETIEGETNDELVLRLTNRMVIEAQRMSRTIDDLLELSRIELGGEMAASNINLVDVVRDAIERVSPIALRKGVPLDFLSTEESHVVWGDFFQLVSAVSNGSAIDFTAELCPARL